MLVGSDCRDVSPDIRSLVLMELAVWINNYREKFLDDKYVRHLFLFSMTIVFRNPW